MEKNYTYEITKDGYYILENGQKKIHQYEPYIPDKTKSYEENAIAQIEELKQMDKQAVKEQATIEDLQEQITELQMALIELSENTNTEVQ